MTKDDDLAALLHAAADEIEVPPAPAELLALAGRRRVRRQRTLGAFGAVAAVAVIAVGVPLAVRSPDTAPDAAGTSPPTRPPLAGCAPALRPAVLPVWARGGFSDPRPRVRYVASRTGAMVAIEFAPLFSPPAADSNNKILWVSRLPQEGASTLRIDARLAGARSAVVRRVQGGPGPSIINLPEPGCWHLTLRWSGHVDTMDLAYLSR